MMPLPPGDFDANSVRRPVDHEGPAPSIHACSSEALPTGVAVSLGRHVNPLDEIIMTIGLSEKGTGGPGGGLSITIRF
jgi:hypothetical protein